jgi:heptosyltransferase III
VTKKPSLNRRIHSAWHSFTMEAITKRLPRAPLNEIVRIREASPLRILVIRHERIGDLLMMTPMIRGLALSREEITIDVLASPENAPVLDGNPHISEVHCFQRMKWWTYPALWRTLRRARYDVVIDGRVNPKRVTATTPLLLYMTGARVRVGAAIEGKERLYDSPVAIDRHSHFSEQSTALASAVGVDPAGIDLRPDIFVSETEQRCAEESWIAATKSSSNGVRLLVNISAAEPLRRWPDERYIALIAGVRESIPDAVPLIVASPADVAKASAIADASAASYVPTSLREAIALVATSDMVFTPDTAISHIASAFPKPVVVLMLSMPDAPGLLSPDACIPWRTPGRIVRSPSQSLDAISADAALSELLAALKDFARERASEFSNV